MLGRKTSLRAQKTTKVPRALQLVAIEGPAIYKVEVGPGAHRLCAADQLRRYYAPLISRPWPLHYTIHDRSTNPSNPDECICEKIVAFGPQDLKKKDRFTKWKLQWQGHSKSHDTCEPATSFGTNFHPEWMEFCRGKKNTSISKLVSLRTLGNQRLTTDKTEEAKETMTEQQGHDRASPRTDRPRQRT